MCSRRCSGSAVCISGCARAVAGRASLEKARAFVAWPAAACFLGAALSKESGIIALAVWFAVLLCRREFRALCIWLAIGAALLAAYCGLRFTAEHTAPPVFDQPPGLVQRLPYLPRAFEVYAGLLAAPVNLHMERGLSKDAHTAVLQIAGGLLLFAAFLRVGSGGRASACSLRLFFSFHSSSPTRPRATFSRSTPPWPSTGFISAAHSFSRLPPLLASLYRPSVPRRRHLMASFACWLCFLGARTWRQNFAWKDQRTFVETTMAAGGNTARMLVNLGQPESDEALAGARSREASRSPSRYFKQALAEKQPGLPFALLGLARAETRARDFDNALKHLQQVEVVPFLRGEALKDRASLEYAQTGNVDLPLLQKAATLEPDNWDIQYTYINTLADSGKINEAVMACKTVVEKQPWRARSWKLMT